MPARAHHRGPLRHGPTAKEPPIRTARSSRRWTARQLTALPGPLAAGIVGVPARATWPAAMSGIGPGVDVLLGRPPRIDLSGLWLAILHGDAPDGPGAGGAPEPTDERLEQVRALVALAQQGDPEAFGQLYARYVDVVYRYVYVRVGAVHMAQDITSETFIKAMRGIDSFTWQGKDIAAWFVTIARNLVNDHAKSARFRLEMTTDDMRDVDTRVDAPDTQVLDGLRDERLLAAVRSLKPEQQECIVLRFMDGLSLAETAEVLGKKENAVKQLQLRAVRALQRALEGEEL